MSRACERQKYIPKILNGRLYAEGPFTAKDAAELLKLKRDAARGILEEMVRRKMLDKTTMLKGGKKVAYFSKPRKIDIHQPWRKRDTSIAREWAAI